MLDHEPRSRETSFIFLAYVTRMVHHLIPSILKKNTKFVSFFPPFLGYEGGKYVETKGGV